MYVGAEALFGIAAIISASGWFVWSWRRDPKGGREKDGGERFLDQSERQKIRHWEP